MTCQFDPAAIVDVARGGLSGPDVDAHLLGCPRCARRLARERALTAGLRALAASAAGVGPSPALEASLLAAFTGQREAAMARRPRWPWLGAAAAVALLAGSAYVALNDFDRGRVRTERASAAAEAAEFVPWPGAAALPAFESGQLVRMELPASVLPLLGLVPATGDTSGTVAADVIVGQDGLARAVRLAP